MAADYTDGGGWAKIDTTAALELADVIALFPPKGAKRYTRMLLVLYASTSKSGTVSMGYRTLAERAGVPEMSARHFLAWMEKNGVLIPDGSKKTRAGQFAVRRWPWIREGGESINRRTPASVSQSESTHPRVYFPERIDAHQIYQSKSEGGGGSATAMPPPQDVTDAPRWPSVMGGAPGACADRR